MLRQVHYSIIEDGGFAGYGQGVEWYVVGLDRDWAYNPRCRAAKRLSFVLHPEAAFLRRASLGPASKLCS